MAKKFDPVMGLAVFQGFGCSKAVSSTGKIFGSRYKIAAMDFKEIRGDRSRTGAERAVLTEQFKKKTLGDLEKIVENARRERDQLMDRITLAMEEKQKFQGTETAMLMIGQQLQAAKNPVERRQLIQGDPRYFQTLASLPAAFFGLSKEQHDGLIREGVAHHCPDEIELFKQYEADEQLISYMEKQTKEAATEMGLYIDRGAIETRVDEKEILDSEKKMDQARKAAEEGSDQGSDDV